MYRAKRRTLRDDGASLTQYAGLIVLASVILGAFFAAGITGQVGTGVSTALCKILTAFQGNCQEPPHKTIPYQCTVAANSNELQVYGSVKAYTVGVGSYDGVTTTIDPNTGKRSAEVSLGDDLEADVGGKLKTKDVNKVLGKAEKKLPTKIRNLVANNFDVTGKAGITGGLHYLYDFNDPAEAQRFRDNQRGDDIDRYTSIPDGVLPDGIKPTKKIADLIRGKHRDNRTPDGVEIDLGSQAVGDLGTEKKGLKGSASGKLTAGGKIVLRPGKGYEVTRTFTGDFSANADLQKLAPYFGQSSLQPNAGFKGNLSYTVKFDKDGNPSQLVMTTEHQEYNGLQKQGKTDTAQQTTRILDLHNPENAQAALAALPDLSGVAAPAVPPITPLIDGGEGTLGNRLMHHSLEVQNQYETKDSKPKNSDFVVVGQNKESSERRLTKSRAIDHDDPAGKWQDLKKCLANR